MFESINEFLNKNKTMVLTISICILIFIIFSVSRCTSIHQVEPEEEQAATTSEAGGSIARQSDDGTLSLVDGEQSTEVTVEQTALIEGYTSTEEDINTILESANWAGINGSGTISFKNNSFTESNGNETTTDSYAICTVETNELNMTQDGTSAEIDVVLLNGSNKYYLLRLLKQVSDMTNEAATTSYAMTCSLFHSSDGYTNTTSAKEMTFAGTDDERLLNAIDSKKDELEETIKSYCMSYYSMCSKATWDQTLNYTYSEDGGTVEFGFGLTLSEGQSDEDTSTISNRIYIDYNMADQTFKVVGSN